ncbi:MAG: PKD domain-containing protein, partial [Chitinophagaceae bacterium]
MKFIFRLFSLLFLALSQYFLPALKAQCSITANGTFCVGSPIEFNCNSVGASGFQWDFNSQGTNNSLCNPVFTFNTPGVKVITLKLKLANGNTCNASKSISINPEPINIFLQKSKKVQCFKNNQFCFVDSSYIIGDSICNVDYVFDDGTKYSLKGNKMKQICHSFQDPAGGTYGVTIQITSCNGCVKTFRYNAIAKVHSSLGLQFNSPQPKRCDSVILTVTNNSLILLDSIQSFTWIWDDGTFLTGNKTTPGNWKTQVSHKYTSQGPNNGNFNVKLAATGYYNGCRDTFTFNAAATNLIIKPSIIASRDSVCASDSKITFKLKDSAIFGAANPLYQYEFPYIPANITRAWTGSHAFTAPGAYKVNFSFTHIIPGCGRTITDTILVLGPQSIIETGGTNVINPSLRYQCVITDTVKFTNFSKFYHNDNNFTDDDSTFFTTSGFNAPLGHKFTTTSSINSLVQKRDDTNIFRVWDFGDDYCERCTTDTKNNINVNKNCRFSKDLYPKHLYTDWDKIYQRYYASTYRWVNYYSKDSGAAVKRKLWADDTMAVLNTGDTLPKILVSGGMIVVKYFKTPVASNDSISFASHRRHFYESKDVKCFTVKLYQKDMKHPLACASENTISLAMMPPSAKNLRKAGVQCLGNASDAYGISFILDETKPGCHATWAEINFDTASNPNAWFPAIGKNLSSGSISMGGLPPFNPPFLISPGSNVPGNVFSRTYNISDIKDQKNGFIDVGLIIGNGIHAGGVYPEMCQDTVYYPKFARFPIIDNSFNVISHRTFGNANEFYKICKNEKIAVAPAADNFSSRADIGSITYDISTSLTGKYHLDAHVLGVTETYKRFNRVHKDSSFLMDSIIITKYQYWNSNKKITSVTRLPIARINKWHAEADVSAVYDVVKNQLALQGLNITS